MSTGEPYPTTEKDLSYLKNGEFQKIEKEFERSKELSQGNKVLRERSGSVDSNDPLVSFLYILMRDHLPMGTVEGIMQEHVENEDQESQFCNGYLAMYAKDVAARLQVNPPVDLKPTFSCIEPFYLEHMGYRGIVSWDPETQAFYGKVLGIKDLVTFGARTTIEVVPIFRETIQDYIETCEQVGKVPEK